MLFNFFKPTSIKIKAPMTKYRPCENQMTQYLKMGNSKFWELQIFDSDSLLDANQVFFSVLRKPEMRKRAAAAQMAESATLKAGQWPYHGRMTSRKSIT